MAGEEKLRSRLEIIGAPGKMAAMSKEGSAYAQAGVDLEAAARTKENIKALIHSTFGKGVLGDAGGFGGLFEPPWRQYEDPVLVSSVDGVGTKLKLAFMMGIHDTVGIDIVSHCANDILVQGARPLFFMDYLAMGSHDPRTAEAVVRGVAQGCRQVGCALIGGETAEMPGFYQPGEYDLAGSIVGIVERGKLIDGGRIAPGDRLIGLESDGLHTNGYSLARQVVFSGAGVDDPLPGSGRTLGEELLRPHRSYVAPVLQLLEELELRGLAHITGGGFRDNIPRVLPAGTGVRIQKNSWEVPPVFRYIGRRGGISEAEMYRVFNMGIGMVLFVAAADAERAVAGLRQSGERPHLIGEVAAGERGVELLS